LLYENTVTVRLTFAMLQSVVNLWDVEAVYFDCTLYTFTALLTVMTYYQLRSGVILASFVIFPAVLRFTASRSKFSFCYLRHGG